MAEPLKAVYHRAFLQSFGEQVELICPAFDAQRFVDEVMDEAWEGRELKERIRHIAVTLGRRLPGSYKDAIEVLLELSGACTGFPYLFFPDFVEVFGQDEADWALSMLALERFTAGSSAEFAIRSFILRDPERTMEQMRVWSRHPDEHVRRLASEGCRPRLPWGQALGLFKRDPSPILPILEQLKADESLYVRKSVANNLNDIAKDHPELVLELAKRWLGTDPRTDWIVRHACRNLIRKAVPEALELFGYSGALEHGDLVEHASLEAVPAQLAVGDSGELRYSLRVREGEPVKLRLEYGVYFVKAGGKTSRKLFLLSDKTVPGGAEWSGTRVHRWADLTTRKHYAGAHRIVLVVNGQEVAEAEVLLEGAPV